MRKTRAACLALFFVLISFVCAGAEEDDLFADIPRQPRLVLHSPLPGTGVNEQNQLDLRVEGTDVERIEVLLTWDGGEKTLSEDADSLMTRVQLPPVATAILVTVRGYGPPDAQGVSAVAEVVRQLKTPKEQLIDSMISLAYSNSRDRRYSFARAHESSDPGICKNFIMRLFDTHKEDYCMLAHPGLALHMPQNRSREDSKPYAYGVEWVAEGPEDGNPFEMVAQYRFDENLSPEENRALARQMLEQAERGDFYQMAGNYVDGNGAHSLLLIDDYDPGSDLLRWTDSNMKGTRVNGERWGYVMYDTRQTVEWMLDAICHPTWGGTLYRLRDDLAYRGEE